MEGTISEIRMFAGNFAPQTWAFCLGQTISIASNTALFSLLGTTYGGNGQTTFALPDFRNRIAVGAGQGPGLSPYSLGETGGSESFTILASNLPSHNHIITGNLTMNANQANGNSDTPQNAHPAAKPGSNGYSTTNNGTLMAPMNHNLASAVTGSQIPVSNINPVLGMNYIICMFGIYPSRN